MLFLYIRYLYRRGEKFMNYVSVTAPDINNGLGCRVTLWVAGCNHNCPGCHNKWTHDYNIGENLENAWDEIAKWLSKDYIKGLTVSGGDPLGQTNFDLSQLEMFLRRVKKEFPDKDIWIYTGYTYDYFFNITDEDDKNNNKIICQEILSYCDTLVDGPYMEDLRDLSIPFRGSKNQRIIDLKLSMHNV